MHRHSTLSFLDVTHTDKNIRMLLSLRCDASDIDILKLGQRGLFQVETFRTGTFKYVNLNWIKLENYSPEEHAKYLYAMIFTSYISLTNAIHNYENVVF